MAVFCVEVNENPRSRVFFNSVMKNLGKSDIVRNPFKGDLRKMDKGLYLIDMTPIWPNIAKYGIFFAVGPFLLFGWGWWVYPGVFLSLLGFFYSRIFFYLMMRAGLKKAGYNDKVRLVPDSEALRRVVKNGTNRSL